MNIFESMNYSLGAVFVMTAFISFLGFLLENIWLAARKGYIDNRNMNTPFLLGYGIAVMGFYFVLGTPSNMRIFGTPVECGPKSQFGAYFLLTFILVSVGEMLLGTVIEKTCKIVWWDYTRIPLHITKYTSVPTSIGFTVVIVTFMDCFFEPIMNKLITFEYVKEGVYGGLLMAVMISDFVISMSRMYRTHELFLTWKLDFREKSFVRTKIRDRHRFHKNK